MTGDEASVDDEPSVDPDAETEGLENGDDDGVGTIENPTADTALERVRANPRLRQGALVVAVAVGITLTWLHWLGLLVGGALVGLVSKTLPGAVGAGAGFGLLVLLVFALTLGGSVWPVLEMTPVSYLVVAAALGIPMLGSLVRGVF
ncbi:hypothetical protein OB919_08515 [Halobacteria archaeon AArc-curdl1]|uniref:Uncharacterized protein n=1 Tax=Natronosalvus hydrolyticus TaxID=2979988 RepID=A0AAP2Z8K6_9EURY|nr:hypothetical protein [Halobacteria archaeon AArc-curdl1]